MVLDGVEGWYNNFMFEELNQLLSSSSRKALSQASIGRSLDLLRQLEYFQHLNSTFGSDYLVILLNTLHPFILRQGFSLISECDYYMLLEGDLREEEAQYQASREVTIGKVLDLNEKKGVRYTARTDCKMLRMKRGLSGAFHIDKKLAIMQRERKKTMMEMQKMLGGESYKKKFEFLQNLSFFNSLGEYDFLELTSKSMIKEYTQGNVTHQYGDSVKMVGCLLSGKVRLNFPMDRSKANKRGVGIYLSQGDWIGLDELLWKHDFGNSGETTAIITMIVWIPTNVFQAKFNLRTNHRIVNRMMALMQAKKRIIQRSLECRINKQQEKDDECGRTLPNRLAEKISCLQFAHQRKRSHFRSSKNQKDIQIPQAVMHRMNFNDFSQPALPLLKLQEKVNLFADEYKAIPISSTHLKEMQRLDKIRNHSLNPPRIHSFIQKDTAYLFQTILDKMPPKTKQSPARLGRTARQQKSSVHYNMSIYNNFRVPKQRALSPTPRKFNTLQVVTNQ